jgi:hypothetical protein
MRVPMLLAARYQMIDYLMLGSREEAVLPNLYEFDLSLCIGRKIYLILLTFITADCPLPTGFEISPSFPMKHASFSESYFHAT